MENPKYKQTDLSKRLRSASATFATALFQSDILAAADEIDRYYTGMLNWKASAEAKDKLHAENDVILKLAISAPNEELTLPRFCPEDVRNYLGEHSAYGEYPKGDWKERVYAKARMKWAKAILREMS